MQQNSKCRLCGHRDDTTNHLISTRLPDLVGVKNKQKKKKKKRKPAE